MNDVLNILRVDSSAMADAGQSTRLATRILDGLAAKNVVLNVKRRDLNAPLPHVDRNWVQANNTPENERNQDQNATLALSDSLIAEIEAADVLLIGVPVYNFGIPASLKSWVDLVCRARKTFAYGENGPQGLMTGKKAIITFASGGTSFGSDIDFASGYMRHVLGFIGITDVVFVVAERHFMVDDALATADAAADAVVDTLSSPRKAA